MTGTTNGKREIVTIFKAIDAEGVFFDLTLPRENFLNNLLKVKRIVNLNIKWEKERLAKEKLVTSIAIGDKR